jgi:hypothetical protein
MLNFPVPYKTREFLPNFSFPSKARQAFPDFRSAIIRKISEVEDPSWTPAEITTALWLDAADSDSLVVDGSDNVEQWNDKSGNDLHFISNNSAKRMTYDNNNLNSLGGLIGDGSDVILTNTNALIEQGTPFYIFFIASIPTGASSIQTLMNIKGTTSGFWFFAYDNSKYEDFTIAGWTKFRFDADSPFGKTTILRLGYDGDSYSTRVNGSDKVNSSTGNIGTLDFSATSIGGRPSGGSSWNGSINEILMVSFDEKTEKIEGYLAHKWGLEANLPSDHPYKTKAPYK